MTETPLNSKKQLPSTFSSQQLTNISIEEDILSNNPIMTTETMEEQQQKPCEYEGCDKLGDPYSWTEYYDSLPSTYYYCQAHAEQVGRLFVNGNFSVEKPNLRPCEYEDCTELGDPYTYPELTEPGDPDRIMEPEEGSTHYYCTTHAGSVGFCVGCGGFWGGIDSFEFGGQICSDCRTDCDPDYNPMKKYFAQDDDYYGDDDDCYDEAASISKEYDDEREYSRYLGE